MQALKKTLSARMGRYVKCQRSDNLIENSRLPNANLSARRVDPDDEKARGRVKAFMRASFYREAPVPVALKFSDPSAEVAKFIEAEMDMYLNSGACIVLVKEDTNDVVGAGMSAVWKRDPDYEIVGADALSWHNVAAELAAEQNDKDPRLVWRDLQFQHLYDLSQREMKSSGRDRTLWASCLSYHSSIRDAGVSDFMLKNFWHKCLQQGMVIGTQSNFRGFDKFVEKHLKNARIADEVKYADEKLHFEGKQVFKALEHIDGIRFYVASS